MSTKPSQLRIVNTLVIATGLLFALKRAMRPMATTIVAAALLGAGPCADNPTEPTKDVASVQIIAAPTNPRVGETTLVSATPVNAGGIRVLGVACTYQSSALAVATAVQSGADAVVTGITVGSATITATCGGKNNSVLITVRPPLVTLTLTKLGNGPGGLFANPPGLSYDLGTVVTVTASPVSGSVFTGWGSACGGIGACVVTMTANMTVTGTFDPRFSLTITTAGTGTGTVTANPPGLSYAPGTNVTLTAVPSANSTFVGWGGACAGTGGCPIAMDANKTVTATFGTAPFAGTWVGTWAWSGPGNNACIFNNGGVFSMTLTQTGSSISGSTSAAGVQTRLDSTCELVSTDTRTGTASGTTSGTTWNLAFELNGGQLVFSGTATLNNNTLTASFVRSTGGTGSFTLNRQ